MAKAGFHPNDTVFVLFQTLEVTIKAFSSLFFIPGTSVFVAYFKPRVTIWAAYIQSHSKDTRFRAHILKTRGDHLEQPHDKYFHSKDTRFSAHILNTRVATCGNIRTNHFIPRTSVFMQIFQTRGDLLRQLEYKSPNPGHPFSCKYFKRSRSPFKAA